MSKKTTRPVRAPIREPRSPEELTLSLRTPELRAAIAKQKQKNKK